jgi:hypothetical protein
MIKPLEDDFSALIMVSATPGHFFQPGKNSLRSNSLPRFQKRPDAACSLHEFGRNHDQPIFH